MYVFDINQQFYLTDLFIGFSVATFIVIVVFVIVMFDCLAYDTMVSPGRHALDGHRNVADIDAGSKLRLRGPNDPRSTVVRPPTCF